MIKRQNLQAKFFWIVLIVAIMTLGGKGYAQEEAVPVEKSLFERLGGEPAIKAVVDDFVTRAAANPAVNFTRQGQPRTWKSNPQSVERLKKHLTQFICVATGSLDIIYEGQDMVTAHKGMKITHAEFDALAQDLKASLNQFNVPEREQNELLAIVGTTRPSIVEETE